MYFHLLKRNTQKQKSKKYLVAYFLPLEKAASGTLPEFLQDEKANICISKYLKFDHYPTRNKSQEYPLTVNNMKILISASLETVRNGLFKNLH
jgi:hypothetical protein